MQSFLFTLSVLLSASFASAQTTKGLTFQAQIKKPDNTLLSQAGLTFNLKVLSSNSCILREEQFTSVTVTNGNLNLVVGHGTVTGADPGLTMAQVMDNTPTTRSGLTCLHANGTVNGAVTTYTPSSADARVLRMSTTVGADSVVGDFAIRASAFAVNAETLAGKTPANFIQTSTNVTQTNLENFFATTAFGQIIAGTYNAPTASTATSATNVSGTVAIANGGTGATNPANARTNLGLGALAVMAPTGTANATTYLRGDGTWASPAGSGTITGVTAGVGLTGGGTSGTVTLDIGTVPVANGGTGQTTYTNGQLLIGNTTGNTLTKSTLTAGTGITITNGTGTIEIAASGGTSPVGAALTSANFWLGSAGNLAAAVSMSGDVTMTNAGATTVGKIGNTTVSGVGLLANNVLQATSSINSGNNVLVTNGTGTGVTSISTSMSSIMTSNGSSVPAWTAISADTFTQYAAIAGRSGGQTITGGTAASNNLTLESTSDATKGFVILAPAATTRVGVGVASPAVKLDIAGSSGATLKIVDTNQAAGRVLTSDANGVASWAAPTAGNAWAIKSAAYTAVAGDRLFVDTTSAAVTITLPASATIGDTIAIIDMSGTFQTNNLTVARNGLNIMGLAEDMTVATQNISFELVYSNASKGWRIK